MKKLLSFVLLSSLLAAAAPCFGQDHAKPADIHDQFVGAWRLASLEGPGADGKIHKAACTGLLVFTRDGHMSVQVIYDKAKTESGASPVQYAQGGYEASFGTYRIDDQHAFTFHVEGALVRTLVGKDLKRIYEFSGKQIIIKSSDPKEHWKVVWESY